MIYEELHPGDKLQNGDEYCTDGHKWTSVPQFMFGDIISKSSTKWRRIKKENDKKKNNIS